MFTMIEVGSMRKAIIPMMSVFLLAGFLIGCEGSGSASPAPAGAQLGPQPPQQPAGAADAMKNSMKQKGGRPTKRGQSGQVPH
jgi:hypothetical protein